jgi:hypothetical protein
MPVYKRTKHGTHSHESSNKITKLNGIYIGFIKDNSDVQKNGRLRIWIPEMGGMQDNENSWKIVNYCSPFFGHTDYTKNKSSSPNYEDSQVSYGMWFVPPDVGNQVTVFFVNGDPVRGYWFGCVPQQYSNFSVPGHAADSNHYQNNVGGESKGKPLPVGEYNKLRPDIPNPDSVQRPVNTTAYNGISQQGLAQDKVRGMNSSSARRESPSQVYGISTPGPEIAGSPGHRTGGSQLVFDDGVGTEYIAFRTKSGAQIKVDETNGLVYVINKKGTSWIQMDADGNVDIFGAKSMSVRALEDINFRADRDVNIEAGRNVNLKAAKDHTGTPGSDIGSEGSGQGGDIKIRALNNLDVVVQKDNHFSVGQNSDTVVGAVTKVTSNGALHLKTNATAHYQSAGALNVKSGAALNLQSAASTNVLAGANIVQTGAAIHLNGPAAASSQAATDAVAATPPTVNQKTNVLADFSDAFRYNRKTGQLYTVASRLITYEPCPEHVNKGA